MSLLIGVVLLQVLPTLPLWGTTPPEWREGDGFRSVPLKIPLAGHVGFIQLPPSQTGIQFSNVLSDDQAALNQILTNGSGVAAGDVDGDGWCDLYFCRLGGPNALYRNLGGRRFEEVAGASGVACEGLQSTGAAFADLDGDGDLDLIVNTLGGGTHLFFNDGHGHFSHSADVLNPRRAGMSLTLADIDGDGDLDLYVANYRSTTVRSTGLQMLLVNGKKTLKPEDRDGMMITPEGLLREYGEVDVLYLNDGKGGMTPESWTSGRFSDENGIPLVTPPRDWGLSAMFHDINGDGVPDLYVCNDFWTPDRAWINDGKGGFRAMARTALPATPTFSMGVDFADLNRDGVDDFLVLDMLGSTREQRIRHASHVGGDGPYAGVGFERPQIERNTLFVGRGDGTFGEIAQFAGLDATDWSWCPLFLDVDLDGYEDVIIGTGNLFDTQNGDAEDRIRARGRWPRERIPYKLLEYPRLPQATHAYRNRGNLTFQENAAAWGLNAVGVSHGMCLADLDNDGGLDVVANVLNGPARLFWNETSAPRVAVRLCGRAPNTRGIGSRVRLLGGAVPSQSQEIICGGRYLSCDDPVRVFAAGSITNDLTLEVEWRSGRRSRIHPVHPDNLYEIREPEGESVSPRRVSDDDSSINPLFEDVSRLISPGDRVSVADESQAQPLLPRRLGQSGPGIAWFDVDGDGWDDLMVGGGQGNVPQVLLNQQGRSFLSVTKPASSGSEGNAGSCVLGIGRSLVMLGLADGIPGRSPSGGVNILDIARGTRTNAIPGSPSATGALCLTDFDGDGWLDVFVGGRYKPGRYPEPATSRIYRGGPTGWTLAREFSDLGMVSGAVWSDLDSDGWPELILAMDWGPVRVFHNDHGTLRETTQELGLSGYTGWWNGIGVGDFDGDGRLDLVVGNWGLNSPYRASAEFPQHLYHGDFWGTGTVDLLEAGRVPGGGPEVPLRDWDALTTVWPGLRDEWPTRESFSKATVSNLFGVRPLLMSVVEATTLESTVFLNRGNRFEPHPLPVEAQWSPAFGVAVGDMDGDGREDVFLAQNCFGVNNSVSLLNGGRGLWLQGRGDGSFRPVPGPESGIILYGEQRGAAAGDYDGDGRVDLAVGQNSAAPRLFHNLRARPGIRVRLFGSHNNPHAIGAQLRWKSDAGVGRVQEVRAGGGFQSQDASVLVMSQPPYPARLEILWPGGAHTAVEVMEAARELEVGVDGLRRTLK